MTKLVTVKTYQNPTNAHLDRSLLESEGIEAFIFGENSMSINPFFTFYPGMGIQLKVRAEDLENANDIIHKTEQEEVEQEQDYYKCPKCNSSDVVRYGRDWRSYLAWGQIFAPFALIAGIAKRRKKCSECGHIWKSS